MAQPPEPARRAVLDAIEPGTVALIDASASSDWLPFALDVDLPHAVGRALGRTGHLS